MGGAARLAHAASKPGAPSVVFEILTGLSLGAVGGSIWKMYHINEKRKAAEFYAALKKGDITVEVKS